MYDFTYMCNINKTDKRNRNRFIDTETKLMVSRREGMKVWGNKRYKLPVIQ